MKKTYSKPEIEITAFTTEDIITASSVSTGLTDGGTVTLGETGITVDISESKWKD